MRGISARSLSCNAKESFLLVLGERVTSYTLADYGKADTVRIQLAPPDRYRSASISLV
jgi:hypothetical protein